MKECNLLLVVLETDLSQTQECLEELKHFQGRDTLEDNCNGHLSRMSLTNEDELNKSNNFYFHGSFPSCVFIL
jgi:hypothetical protein